MSVGLKQTFVGLGFGLCVVDHLHLSFPAGVGE